jgi:hypothetical protein
MEIKDGKEYRTGKGAVLTIGGTTREHKDWCWSIQGNWYERATGRAIGYRPTGETRMEGGERVRTWEHYVREPSGDDIVGEA